MDDKTPLFWLGLTFFFIMTQAFYSMQEMAAVSFNRVRLQYYVSQGNRRARWLQFLLQKPSRLFGTTLVCLNIALQIGSECSRQFYLAMGLRPDLAPLTQVFIVVILAELAPMFAARKYTEHVAMLGIPLVYLSSRILSPIVWLIDGLSKVANRLVYRTSKNHSSFYLSRDELEKAIEPKDSDPSPSEQEDFQTIVSNIFGFRQKLAYQVMEPLNTLQMVPSNCTVAHMRKILSQSYYDCIPVYHRTRKNIVGTAFPRDCLRLEGHERVRDHARAPWFVARNAPVIEILQQFRHNNRSIAIVLDDHGYAMGIIALEDVLAQIFGKRKFLEETEPKANQVVLERTFPGTMPIETFNRKFHASINPKGNSTLAQLLHAELGHHPEKGDSIQLSSYEFTIKESGIRGAKTISVKTIV